MVLQGRCYQVRTSIRGPRTKAPPVEQSSTVRAQCEEGPGSEKEEISRYAEVNVFYTTATPCDIILFHTRYSCVDSTPVTAGVEFEADRQEIDSHAYHHAM